ncbi:MAG: SpoIIE family protein phosphatase [Treponemataceae bacterium]|nr:SpoIIE family protein phosphatase [Treponemataceae bacterium]
MGVLLWQEAELKRSGENAEYHIYLSLGIKEGKNPWLIRSRVAGPYIFRGTEPAIASITVDSKKQIWLAVVESGSSVVLLRSDDRGASFTAHRFNGDTNTSLAPRLFIRSDGGYLLFVSRGQEESLSLFYSRSDDGISWTAFEPFVTESGFRLNFLPTHGAQGGRDYVVFQSLRGIERPTFQLFLKTSSDGGKSWSSAVQLTTFADPYSRTRNEAPFFDNQRPFLLNTTTGFFLTWERRSLTASPQIYGMVLGYDGTVVGEVQRISPPGAYANNPVALMIKGAPAVFWFDNRRGQNRIYMALKKGLDWEEVELSGAPYEASFARPFFASGGLQVFFQASQRGNDRIYLLAPDTSAPKPFLRPQNFEDGISVRSDIARISWSVPEDPSGILGFSFLWSRDPTALPPETLMLYSPTASLSLPATEDGPWYFSIRARDFAGNWSEAARLTFIRDTTPPGAPELIPPELDAEGYLISNSGTLSWNAPPDEDVAGFLYSLEYLDDIQPYARYSPEVFTEALERRSFAPAFPRRDVGNQRMLSLSNIDNGVWRLAVVAYDRVGNVGPVATLYFRTNKFVPYTAVSSLTAVQNDEGKVQIRIWGRGFIEEGPIERIVLDQDGKPPYEREFLFKEGAYRIVSDREIRDLSAEDLPEGSYRLLLYHPRRGWYRTAPLVHVAEMGTIKFGDYQSTWKAPWRLVDSGSRYIIDVPFVVLIFSILCSFLMGFVALRGMGGAIAETFHLRQVVTALMTGAPMPSQEKIQRLRQIRRRGISLRIKLAAFTALLVITVVLLIALPLSYMMTRTQEATLLSGLRDRSRVLLESLASGARAYLPSGNVLELGFLPAQVSAVPEARYATITGYGKDGTTSLVDHVWATNDPDILKKIDTPELEVGQSVLSDPLSSRVPDIAKKLDEEARSQVGELSATIGTLTREALSLALKTDAESVRRRDDLQQTIRDLEARLNERLNTLSAEIGSEPAFPQDRLPAGLHPDGNHRYIFFKPVMYRQGTEDIYFRGLVRLEVSIDSIIKEVERGRQSLVQVTSLVTLVAIGIGIIGALILSSLIIRPIQRLVRHVEMIRDTEDKSLLEGKDIQVKTRDEIAILGDTINDMTHGLVKAALAAKDLTIGKEIQKKFIPLETDSMGNKLTTGHKETRYAEYFGYYEGAKGVSGDYFDIVDLDGRYFAIMKCDVAGKGVPAALIMIQVATLFISYFKNWKPTAEGMRIERLVYEINDFIENLRFRGRFAAFTLCLFDSQTGVARFCNAGDNQIHWYDARERQFKTRSLPETPAAGVLPSELINMKGGYQVQTVTFNPGDILLLYTDGIEEAKRKFRNEAYEEILCTEGEKDSPHENHVVGQGDEELGAERIKGIIEAVMGSSRFTLIKHHSPSQERKFDFDFSRCKGSVEELVMALVSVEKVFRMYRPPMVTEEDRILVDKKVDTFLKNHFIQYRSYCGNPTENLDQKEYLYYTQLREDEQYDDLTILAIQRK